MSQADVSAIIPTCDRPDYLREAIASVLAEQLPPREILVVDNGVRAVDPDDMPPQVQLYRLAPRVGVSRARDFGAAMASSRYLAFLDDDDWWAPDFLGEAMAAMDEQKVRCVYGRKDEFLDGRSRIYKVPTPDTLTIPTLLRRNPGTSGQNLVIERRLFLEVGGFDEWLKRSQDRALALEILLAGEPIGIAPNAVAVLRHHEMDRLRHHPVGKLPFVWKYRRLYSIPGFLLAIAHILAAAALASLRDRLLATSLRSARS